MADSSATSKAGSGDPLTAGTDERASGRQSLVLRSEQLPVLIVARPGEQQRIVELVGPEMETCLADSPEQACAVLEARRIAFVLASAQACTEQLLTAMAGAGLATSCAFIAAPGDIERLVEAYAAQFTFRVVSHDIGRTGLAAVLASALSPRGADRRSLPGIAVELHLPDGRLVGGELLDLSNRGVAVRVDPKSGLLAAGSPVRLVRLLRDEDVLLTGVKATVRYVEVLAAAGPGAIAYKIGLEFRRPAPERPESELFVTEPLRVQALLTEGLRRSPLSLSLPNTTRALGAGRAEVRSGEVTLLTEVGGAPEVEILDVVEGRFELAGASYSFVSAIKELRGPEGRCVLKIPRALRAVRQRRSLRFRPDPARPISVVPISPFAGSLSPRPVLNITSTGAAFALDDATDILPAGTELLLTLHLQDGSHLSCRASVRSLTQSATSGATVCGVEFDGLDGLSRARLADAIAGAGQPTVRDGSGTPFAELFQFFTETNFLYPEKLASLDIPGVTRTLGTLLARPNDLMKTSLVVSEAGIQAHASGFRSHDHTWMLQHLAARPAGKTTMTRGRLLNLAVIQYLEQLPGIEWVKIWFRPQNRWPARVFGRFARRLADPRLSSFRTYAYLISSTDAPDPGTPGVLVRIATDAELHEVETYFVARRDPVLQAADCLTANTLRLGTVNEAYAALGLERRREILVAKRADALAGFSLAEVSSPGLNFSELTNAFRVFTLDPDDEVARHALISATTAHYRRLGRTPVRALAEPGEVHTFEALGFAHPKDYSCWTWHRSQYQAFCEHVLRLRG